MVFANQGMLGAATDVEGVAISEDLLCRIHAQAMDAPKKYDIDDFIALCRVWKKRAHLMLFLPRVLVVLGKEWSFSTAGVLEQGPPGCMLRKGVVPTSKTVLGALRAFPRLVEPFPEGQPAKKPDWRRLHLEEAKKDAFHVLDSSRALHSESTDPCSSFCFRKLLLPVFSSVPPLHCSVLHNLPISLCLHTLSTPAEASPVFKSIV